MLKKILIGLVGLIVALLLIAFALPGKIEVSKSISINAPAENVFGEINDLEKNPNWSYWNNQYKDGMTVTYGDVRTGVGAFSSWDGEESGKGSMTITESVPNQSIKIELDFMEGGTADSWYTFEPEGEGTKLTTGFSTELGMNPFMRWIGFVMIKPEMNKAFDYNLGKLKEIAEAKPLFTVTITEVDTKPVSYIGVSSTMSMDDIDAVSAQMGKSYGELMTVLQKAKVEMTSPPFALYPRWDEEKKEFDMVCALSVPANATLPAQYKITQLAGGKAVKAIHLGDYNKLGETHDQIYKYLGMKKLEHGTPWEVYITDPEAEPDMSKWVTEVYYPIK